MMNTFHIIITLGRKLCFWQESKKEKTNPVTREFFTLRSGMAKRSQTTHSRFNEHPISPIMYIMNIEASLALL